MSQSLYQNHISQLQAIYEQALAREEERGEPLEAVLIHSGSEQFYYGDDRAIPFQAFGHFCHWLPINRPDQFLLIQPGSKPRYIQFIARDFWHDQSIDNDSWWAESLDIVTIDSIQALAGQLPDSGLAYLGPSQQPDRDLGIGNTAVNPQALLHYLDYYRAYKSDYELDRLRQAAELALKGHAAARSAFLDGQSEYAIHMAYLTRCRIQENETPYTNIVALNDKAAILHYQHKRVQTEGENKVLLIDAGCRIDNYGSDITRTSINDRVHPVFAQLLNGMEALEQELVARVAPGESYVGIHQHALAGVAGLLRDLEICKGSVDELLDRTVAQLFMPHGVGHLLGIQVHDVGGHQQDIHGKLQAPPAHSPALRNTRLMETNMVFTIEPGCYFIPMLLEPERQSARGKLINWSLVDDLYGHGGIRIEDNIRVTKQGHENLSRPGPA